MKSFILLMLLIASWMAVCAPASANDYFHSANGTYPSQIQAQDAYDKAKRDNTVQFVNWLGVRPEPMDIRLFACKDGYYSHLSFQTYSSKNYITCKVAFLDGWSKKVFSETINFRRIKSNSWEFMIP
ncbi:hypothetical protein [Bartonella choladocola]|uniref:Uncharacterized protein n=1 Tax=Bartonella choladocola TaxID=2750995 RepID=A0A1U9MJS7_9HYPH|nr:hypothetical protein [Bartonella choladocola]AQT47973.1 hypothetical protein BBC0122_018780 [Bartonella choladocola]